MLYVVKQGNNHGHSLKVDDVIRHRSLEAAEQNKRSYDIKSLMDKNDTKETLYLGFLDKQYGLVGSARMVKASSAKLGSNFNIPKDTDPKAYILMDCQFYVPENSDLFKCSEKAMRSQFQNMCNRFYENLIAYLETKAMTSSIPSYYFYLDEESLHYLKQGNDLNFAVSKKHQAKKDGVPDYMGSIDTSHLVQGRNGNTRLMVN